MLYRTLTTDELIDLLWLPKRVHTVEDVLEVLQEIDRRQLTHEQRAIVDRLYPAERRAHYQALAVA